MGVSGVASSCEMFAVELGAELLHLAEALVRRRELGDLLLEVRDDAARLDAEAFALHVGRRHHPLAAPAEVAGHLLGEVARVDGLLEEAVAADGEARVAIALRGDRDDRDTVERRLGPQTERDLEPVEAGNIQVDEDDVGALGDGETNAFETVGRVDHLVAVTGEELADEQAGFADRPRYAARAPRRTLPMIRQRFGSDTSKHAERQGLCFST